DLRARLRLRELLPEPRRRGPPDHAIHLPERGAAPGHGPRAGDRHPGRWWPDHRDRVLLPGARHPALHRDPAERLPHDLRYHAVHHRGGAACQLPGGDRLRRDRSPHPRHSSRRSLMTIARLRHNPRFLISGALVLAVFAFALIGPLLPTGGDPFRKVGRIYDTPSAGRWVGTDNFGRDVFVQLMYGLRSSLVIGLIAGAVATAIGVVLGTVAGFKGGVLEELLMGVTNVVIAIPAIVFLILLSYALSSRSVLTMALIIGVTSWPWTARAVRAQASSLRTREHVDLARLSGAGNLRLIAFEVVPYMLSYISLAFVLQLATAILAEAGLSLLGLGPSNTVSLGIMLYWALLWESVRTGAWWAFVPPTLLLTVIAFALLMLQSSLNEVFNPRLQLGARRARPGAVPMAATPLPLPIAAPPAASEADPISGAR